MAKKETHQWVHYAAALIFAFAFVAHAWRLWYQYPFVVGYTVVPMWLSWVAVVVTGVLAVSLWRTR